MYHIKQDYLSLCGNAITCATLLRVRVRETRSNALFQILERADRGITLT